MDIVSTHNLSKRYGDTTVVDDVSLRIPEGCVYGFLGPNGSGKSTTMKMLLSLVRPSAGEVTVFGQPMTQHTRRALLGQIGSLIEAPPGYGHLTGAENMRIVQRALGLPRQQIEWAVQTVRMQNQMTKKVRDYSLGMKQRLGIAMALARQPRLLILDEPTNGLDPAGIEEIRGLLSRLAEGGVTVMVSSHLLEEIDRTATVLGILDAGRLIFQGSREELFAASTPDVLIDTDDAGRAGSLLNGTLRAGGVPGGTAPVSIDHGALRVPGIDRQRTAQVVAELVGAGAPVYGVRRDEQSLEDVFMDLTGGGGRL